LNRATGPYSQPFIFFVAQKCARAARVFDLSRLERLVRDRRSSLMGSFVSYEENKML